MGAFAGTRALVTGGSSGIGLATARQLALQGAQVAVLDLQPPTGGELFFVQGDIGDTPSVTAAAHAASEALGGLDILVNNAGVGAQGGVEDNPDSEWHRVLNINVVGHVRVTRSVLPSLRASSCAAIVNVASIAATAGLPDRALYSATKGAVLALTLAMAADLLADGIRVNAVNPGTVNTPWVERLLNGSDDPEGEHAALAARQPHGRLVTPEEVAEAICYLASPAAGSVTGTALAVDGGMAGLRLRPKG